MKTIYNKLLYTATGLPIIRNIAKPWQGRACILCYHRIDNNLKTKQDSHPNGNLISESAFYNQMQVLSNEYDVLSMDEMSEHLSGPSSDFKVAVTFDDGYRDNLTVALPILEKFNIPATIYVTTRFPEGNNWMWWYEIWDCLANLDDLTINFMGVFQKYNVTRYNSKKECFLKLTKWMSQLTSKEQFDLMSEISKTTKRRQYPELCLNWDEIKYLDSNPLITIGAHSHTHPKLKNLTYEESFFEINSSKEILEDKLSRKIEHFAYPFGGVNDIGKKELEIIRKCGFDTATTTIKKPINDFNRYLIPRALVQEYMSDNGFRAVLSGWNNLFAKYSN